MKVKKNLLALFLLAITPYYGWGTNFNLHGYYKSFFISFLLPDYKVGNNYLQKPTLGAVNNRLRLKFSSSLTTWVSLEAAYDFSPRIQDPSLFQEDLFFSHIEPLTYRVDDISPKIYPKSEEKTGSFAIFNNLDRLFFSLKLNFADIYVGRQPISWGTARVINPTDVIAPFAFNELDTEERRGVDAFRIRVPLGMMDEIDIGWVAGENFAFQESAFYVRSKFYVYQTDFSFLMMSFREHLMMGFNLARAVGGAGYWLEVAYVIPYFREKHLPSGEKNYLRLSTGFDYNFSSLTYGFLEYHFNSAGESDPKNYVQELLRSPFQEGTVYLLGKHYLNLGLTYQINPLLPFTGLMIFNLNDQSLTLSPTLEYNIAPNIYLTGGAYIGIGKNPELLSKVSVNPYMNFHSEFGAYPDMFFTSFKIYF